ncbi:MAG TPA: ERCC4 domain-containing protein [Acidobacteriota bacterium]|nr:ERCC4 domain-containing protein [Acidobacteriota bacterium]
MKRLVVIVDNLMEDSPVAERLRERGVEVTASNLLAGDLRITDNCAVMHISAEEFDRWILAKEFFRRIAEFKRAVEEPVVIVEGKRPSGGRAPSPDSVRGALAFVAVHNRVPVLFTATPKETADFVFAMANQVQNGMGERIGSTVTGDESCPGGNGKGKVESLRPCEEIMQLVPDVGLSTARAMLERFGSLREIFSASAKELAKVDGLGPKRAKKIAAFFESNCGT